MIAVFPWTCLGCTTIINSVILRFKHNSQTFSVFRVFFIRGSTEYVTATAESWFTLTSKTSTRTDGINMYQNDQQVLQQEIRNQVVLTKDKDKRKEQLSQSWELPPNWLKFLVIALLFLGIFFRFVNLDRKVYWYDETMTSLRIHGHTHSEYVQQLFQGQVISATDLQKYQTFNPEKDLKDTMNALAGNAEHPPLYYLIARFWTQWFGDSVAATRSLSAAISLLVFPLVYWLCLELFNSSLLGWMSIALFSISPFHVLYAQEARQYSLWIVTILLSSAALLRAIRLKTKSSWGLYAVSLSLGFYTFLMSGLVAIAHGIYVAIVERRLNKISTAYIIASLAGCLTFVPWILVFIANLSNIEKNTSSGQRAVNIFSRLQTFSSDLGQVFLDFKLGLFSAPLILIVVGYAVYFVYRNAPKKGALFILSLVGISLIGLIIPDLIFGLKLSTRSRYLIPFYLGSQLAVAYLLTAKIFSMRSSKQQIWKVIAALLFSGGVLSCAMSSQAEAWWNKGASHYNINRAEIINQASRPLLISSNNSLNPGDLLSLSYLLDSKVRLQLVIEPNIPQVPDGYSDIFVYNTSKELNSKLEKDYKIKTVDKRANLRRLEKKSAEQ